MSGTNLTIKPLLRGSTIILVEPQLGENIGMAARAMGNFGLSDMRLVNPREGWPNDKARSASSKADYIIDGVQVFETLEDAIKDMNFVIATTARARNMQKPAFDAEEGAKEVVKREQNQQKCAILFGRERWGLNNDEVALSDAIMSYPVDPAFASLNIAQAVIIYAYAHMRALNDVRFSPPALVNDPPASKEETLRMYEQLEIELDAAGFFKTPEKKEGMIRNLRTMFGRAELTEQEVRTMRGVIKALTHYHPNHK